MRARRTAWLALAAVRLAATAARADTTPRLGADANPADLDDPFAAVVNPAASQLTRPRVAAGFQVLHWGLLPGAADLNTGGVVWGGRRGVGGLTLGASWLSTPVWADRAPERAGWGRRVLAGLSLGVAAGVEQRAFQRDGFDLSGRRGGRSPAGRLPRQDRAHVEPGGQLQPAAAGGDRRRGAGESPRAQRLAGRGRRGEAVGHRAGGAGLGERPGPAGRGPGRRPLAHPLVRRRPLERDGRARPAGPPGDRSLDRGRPGGGHAAGLGGVHLQRAPQRPGPGPVGHPRPGGVPACAGAGADGPSATGTAPWTTRPTGRRPRRGPDAASPPRGRGAAAGARRGRSPAAGRRRRWTRR